MALHYNIKELIAQTMEEEYDLKDQILAYRSELIFRIEKIEKAIKKKNSCFSVVHLLNLKCKLTEGFEVFGLELVSDKLIRKQALQTVRETYRKEAPGFHTYNTTVSKEN